VLTTSFADDEYKLRIKLFIVPDINKIQEALRAGDTRTLARCISWVENDLPGSDDLLKALPTSTSARVIGVTGPPGAGKSTLVNALISKLVQQQKRVAVLSVDPSSPFHYGALLGDRIRMSEHYLNPLVYIRSLASRGSLGGLNRKIIEILQVLQSAPFDTILIETVGVGQSEVEIAGIADTTLVVMVPEAGDEVQTMKAGVMEIADIFIVNKADRDQAELFVKNLQVLAHEKGGDWQIPVVKCIATRNEGLDELISAIEKHAQFLQNKPSRHYQLMAEKAWQLIQEKRMQDISKLALPQQLEAAMQDPNFNLFRWIEGIA
jgi:LAO/AO transport system kinase